MAQQKQIPLGTMRLWVWSLASPSGLRIQHCSELWRRLQKRLGYAVDPALLWLWHRLAAVALIWLLAWEPPIAASVALKEKKKKKKERKNDTSSKTVTCHWLLDTPQFQGRKSINVPIYMKYCSGSWLFSTISEYSLRLFCNTTVPRGLPRGVVI